MASGKKSFILYCDIIHTLNTLSDEEAGKLFKHVLAYVNDLNPQTDDRLLQIAFEPIKQALKRDLEKWIETSPDRSEKARIAGLASAAARQLKATQVNSLVENELNQLKPTNSTVIVSDIVSENVIEDKKVTNKFVPDFKTLPLWMVDPLKLWIKHKSEKKQGYKQTGLETLVEQLKKEYPNGKGFFDAVRHSISNNYSGIFSPNTKPQKETSLIDAPDEF